MPSLALACRLSAATAAIRSLFSRAKSIARRYNEPLLAIEEDLSNVYQDSAGTLPATVGSPIGRINDLTGLGNNATQATAGNRPILAQYNGHPSASFNGTTNSLQLATNPIGSNLSQPYTIIVAGVVGALGATRSLCGDSARNPKITSDGKLLIGHNGNDGRSGASVLSQGQAFVAAMFWDGSVVTIELNGAPYLSSALGAPITAAASFFIGQRGNNSEFFNGQITGCAVFDRVLTDSERTTIGKAFAKELGLQKTYDYNLYVANGGASLDLDFTSDNYQIWGGV